MEVDSVQFSTFDKRHDKIEAHLRLKEIFHSTEKGMVELEKDFFFELNFIDNWDYFVFPNGLDSVLLICIFQYSQENSSITTSS